MDARRYLSVEEFARYSGLSLATVRRYLKSGKLPYRQPAGPRSRVLIPLDALDIAAPPEQIPSTPPATAPAPDQHPPDSGRLAGPRPQWTRRPAPPPDE